MSLPLPAVLYGIIREWISERRSGQITIEFRSGSVVGYQMLQRERVTEDLEYKASPGVLK